jgi:5-methylcytosine-specific restriction endonuclease McrA
MPSRREQASIFARDGWPCRFCGTKVICKLARSVITRAFAIEANWTSAELQQHSALYALASSLDHVIPHGRRGKNEHQNYVTACYCCQFGRGEWTIEEAELEDPRHRQPVVDG